MSLKHDNLSLLSWNVFLYKFFYVLNLDWEFRGGILFKVLGFKKLISFFCLGQEGIYLNNLPMDFQFQASNASIPQFSVHREHAIATVQQSLPT